MHANCTFGGVEQYLRCGRIRSCNRLVAADGHSLPNGQSADAQVRHTISVFEDSRVGPDFNDNIVVEVNAAIGCRVPRDNGCTTDGQEVAIAFDDVTDDGVQIAAWNARASQNPISDKAACLDCQRTFSSGWRSLASCV